MIKYSDLPQTLECISCYKIAKLNEHTRIFPLSIGTVIVKILRYKCECGDTFTTSQSDTISMMRVARKRRALERKLKINKLNK